VGHEDGASIVTDQNVLIEVYSDVICPWCYVGKRRLERALHELRETVRAHVVWRPFQLNPTMPKEGMDRTTYLRAKFGSLETYRDMEHRLLEVGGAERIAFAFEKISRTPNTFLAHRLIWYAETQGCQDALIEQLFKGLFENGLDIGSMSILAELAGRAGLQADEFLKSEEGAAEIEAEESVGRELGIRGVPYFVFQKSYGISGAQPVDVFVDAVERIRHNPSIAAGSR
jgi:predicted DsbA family dithiol-disulfide isomerase